MRVRLKGINCVRKRLANGSEKTFWYAWKGGPALPGQLGTPEFIASYNEAVARKRQIPTDVLLALLQGFQGSDDFRSLAPRTRADYVKKIRIIEKKFADFPLEALADRRTRGIFMAWRDELSLRSRRQADYAWSVLARILSWAQDRGLTSSNPCVRGGRLYRSSRNDKVWTAEDEANFLAKAPSHLHLPLMLALWTGQRQGDLLGLTWNAYDGQTIRLKQSKTGSRVLIPVGAPLKAMLDSTARGDGLLVLVNSEGRPWTPDGFRSSWRKACLSAGVTGLTFHDLRGTSVSRLAIAGCTTIEIATLTGHSLKDVGAILDAFYLNRDPAMAKNAIRKLELNEKKVKTPN